MSNKAFHESSASSFHTVRNFLLAGTVFPEACLKITATGELTTIGN